MPMGTASATIITRDSRASWTVGPTRSSSRSDTAIPWE